MFKAAIAAIHTSHLLPELKATVLELLLHEQQAGKRGASSLIFKCLQEAFGDEANVIHPFVEAWSMMCATASHLDHLQDGDQDDLLTRWNMSIPLLYTALIGCLYGSQEILYTLSEAIPQHRRFRLQRAWNTVMLRMVGGQYRDLMVMETDTTLVEYQAVAQAKAGSTFALAFGGTAMLLTDDQHIIATLTTIGEMYGALIQYNDDIKDYEDDCFKKSTLPQSLLNSSLKLSQNHTPHAFLSYITSIYLNKINEYMILLPHHFRQTLNPLFENFT